MVIGNDPLDPLEEEIFLVQSNGLADWLKISLAQDFKICSSTRVLLPARFLWEAYRAVLGAQNVPKMSPLDKWPMLWRLMDLLPDIVERPGFAALKRFLSDNDQFRTYQLAQKLAELIELYQVYRLDWLGDWEYNSDVLAHPERAPQPLHETDTWQAELWRIILEHVPAEERQSGRPQVHGRFMDALEGTSNRYPALPKRVVVFGMSSLPQQALEALGALSSRMQVILAVCNPCRHYWADIISGREFFKQERRRQQLRNGVALDTVQFEQMHHHSHPLLASWGQLGRDYIRLLDQYDDTGKTRAKFPKLTLDLFSDPCAEHLLARVQGAILDLLPLAEHPRDLGNPHDDSFEFHVTHSVQREVEVLHDRLLDMLDKGKRHLRPRDIVVMVPDIGVFAPAIHAVFGQYNKQSDLRHIPYDIADMAERRVNPVLVALEWLMRLPVQRCLQSELRDLLDVPAIAANFGLSEEGVALVGKWIERSGVRWGLDEDHRGDLGLAPAGLQNSWIFGVHRMMLGYANGAASSFRHVEPFGEVGGLDAALIGSLSLFIENLLHWRVELASRATPQEWSERARRLVADFFDLKSDRDRMTQVRLETSLRNWSEHCELAGFDTPIGFDVACEAWLGPIDEASLSQRFVSGGVTFCTLMPMRAIPFKVVCLLGMNDGDFPRRANHADFDLLSQPGQYRPGDRSRKNDDRYLMLEALLSARECFYVSWVGKNIRDNSAVPPSILAAQLRDYLCEGWGVDLKMITQEHPMQPFSRRYFEKGEQKATDVQEADLQEDGQKKRTQKKRELQTFAHEWFPAHHEFAATRENKVAWTPQPDHVLRIADLADFMRNPVRHFFRHRMQVQFDDVAAVAVDHEPFGMDHLEQFKISTFLLEDGDAGQEDAAQIREVMAEKALRLSREGRLPIKGLGEQVRSDLVERLSPARRTWIDLCRKYQFKGERIEIDFEHRGVRIRDSIEGVRTDGEESVLLHLDCRELAERKGSKVAAHKLIASWLRLVAASAAGTPMRSFVVCCNGLVECQPIPPQDAIRMLNQLVDCWLDGMTRPLPTACKTGIAIKRHLVLDPDSGEWVVQKREHVSAYQGSYNAKGEVDYDPCLARMWRDWATLEKETDWKTCAQDLYGMYVDWIDQASHVQVFPLATYNEVTA